MSIKSPPSSFDWFSQAAQDIMNTVQQVSTGSDANVRNAAPYYQFGNVYYGATPNHCPSVRWRQGTAKWDYTKNSGGFGVTGSLATLMTEQEVRIVGIDRAQALAEMNLLMSSLSQQRTRPLVSDFQVTEWSDQDDPATNGKEGFICTFTLPIVVPIPQSVYGIVQVLSASVTSSISGSTPSSFLVTSASLSRITTTFF